MVAVDQLSGDGAAGRRHAEGDAVAVLVLLAAQGLGGDGCLAGHAQVEVGLAAAGRLRQAQQRLDQDGLRVPGDGLVVQGQAGFFVAVMQGLRLGPDPV